MNAYQVGDRVKLLKHSLEGRVVKVRENVFIGNVLMYVVEAGLNTYYFYELPDLSEHLSLSDDDATLMTPEAWFDIKLQKASNDT